jgi:hypothetical protein
VMKFCTTSQAGTVSLTCLNCGYAYSGLSTFWLRRLAESGGDVKCRVCGGNVWRNTKNCTPAQRDNVLWKKLLVAQNKEKFVPGRWKLNRKYKKFYDKVEDLSPKARLVVESVVGKNPVPVEEEDETE